MSNINDPRALRDAFGTFSTGVTVVTTIDSDGAPKGFTANSFCSVSLDPPLLLVCIAKSSSNLETFQHAKGFAVNILSESQQEVSNTFARPVEDRFASVSWKPGPSEGSPVFEDVSAWFDCSNHDVVDAGDHIILIGKVEAFEAGVANGLGYARGRYFTLGLERQTETPVGNNVVVSAVVERSGQVVLTKNVEGNLGLPEFRLKAGSGAVTQLSEHLQGYDLQVSVGFIYSIYEESETGVSNIVYHCVAADGEPGKGDFMDIDSIPLEKITDLATRAVVKRFAEESEIGQFGVYFGDESQGEIRSLAAEG